MTELAEDRIISEEYKLWKKNVPFMYDHMMTRALEWPSPTVQWLPEVETLDDEYQSSMYKLLLGTHTLNEQNYLLVANVNLPGYIEPEENDLYCMKDNQFGAFSSYDDKYELQYKIAHEEEVKHARVLPNKTNIIATKNDHDLFLYNIEDCELDIDHDEIVNPLIKTAEVNSTANLVWNPSMEGDLLCAKEQNSVVVFNAETMENKESDQAKVKYSFSTNSPTSELLCVDWHRVHPSIMGAVSSEGEFFIWDVRSKNMNRASHQGKAHKSQAIQIEFNPFSAYVFATSSYDRSIGLWDLRNLNVKLHSIIHPTDYFNRIHWSPHCSSLLAASTSNRRIQVYDLERIFDTLLPDEEHDGPSTLAFSHAGHTANVFEFDWNPFDPLVVCSVSDDNVLQIWQMMGKCLSN